MRKGIQSVERAGAKDIRAQRLGRLGSAEMSRLEFYHEGRVPLHTLHANIDYGFYETRTTFGHIGVKVWIHYGDITDAEYYRSPAESPCNRSREDRRDSPHRERQGHGNRQQQAIVAPVAESTTIGSEA